MLHTPESEADPCRPIAAGDLVIVYEGFDSMKAVRVDPEGQYNNKYGMFMHKDWIGRPFGSRVLSKKGDGWVMVLAPTPELWTTVLRHRTQILYAADIALVVAFLELRPGAVVLESGTGSGSLTHSLARAVAPDGKVWTYEFHEQRATTAAQEFKDNGLGELVTVIQRDIEQLGFPEERHGTADAVFLDLPRPHMVVPSAARCVQPNGMFCSFSPCIEQVQKTCEALNANGFRDIRTMEILVRQWEVTRQALQTDMDAPPPQHTGKRQQQGGGGRGGKRQKGRDGGAVAPAPAPEAAAASGQDDAAPAEAAPAAGDGAAAAAADEGVAAAAAAADKGVAGAGTGEPAAAALAAPPPQPPQRVVVSKPLPFGRGHTGYLTFARRVVDYDP